MKNRFAIIILISSITLGGILWSSHTLFASPTGITGYSGNPSSGGLDCNICHSGGITPDVLIDGAPIVAPGELVTYTLRISGGQQTGGGFNVSTDDGVLTVISGAIDVRESGGELTHTGPKVANADGDVEFAFNWTAPITPGLSTLYGAGNSVNLANGSGGDAASRAVIVIAVGVFSETVYLPLIQNGE